MWFPVFFVLAVSVLSALTTGCSHVFYQGSKELYHDPNQYQLHFTAIPFMTADGVRLNSWYFPALKTSHKKNITVVQFHGNAENISTHFGSLVWLITEGYDFLTFDYRGYGASQGEPSQAGLNLDALAAIHLACEKRGNAQLGTQDIVLYGQSLGGAVLMRAVLDLAPQDRSRVRNVIVDSTFYSYKEAARGFLANHWLTFLFQPLASLFVSDEYSPETVIGKISPIPFLIIHGNSDAVVSYSNGEKIFQIANQPKEFWTVENGTHIDSMTAHHLKYRKKLLEYIASHKGVN